MFKTRKRVRWNERDASRCHNDVPSFFCESDIDKFLNYNNITHKLRDTHQARDYHPYHYYYYYYYYTVFPMLLRWFAQMGKSKWWSAFSRNVQVKRKCGCNNNSNNNNIIIVVIVCTENSLQSIQSKLPKLSGHSGNSRGSVMECVSARFCLCVHVALCSYCKSSVQRVKQCSQSHLEAFQWSLWEGAGGAQRSGYTSFIARGDVSSICGTSRNPAKTRAWSRNPQWGGSRSAFLENRVCQLRLRVRSAVKNFQMKHKGEPKH